MKNAAYQGPDRRKNGFGAMRLLFAFCVIFSHAPQMIDGDFSREPFIALGANMTLGMLAVDGFFIISGYLLAGSYLSTSSLRDFLTSRILRIYPAFIVASLICIFLVAPISGGNLQSLGLKEWLVSGARLFLLMPPEVPGSFAALPIPALDGPMWTIRYEFRCYLLVALLGAFGLLYRKALVAVFTAALYTVAAFQLIQPTVVPDGIVHKLVFNLVGDPAIVFKLTAIFMSGVCLRLYRDKISFHPVLLIISAVVWLAAFFTSQFIEIVTGTLGAYILLWASVGLKSEILQRINNRYDYSYGVYLYAWPIASLILLVSLDRFVISPIALSMITVLLSLVAGAISWYLLEKPALKHKRSRDALPVTAGRADVAKQADMVSPV